MQMTPRLWQKARRNRRASDESERGGESWLKTQRSKVKIVASGPITSWQIDGKTEEAVRGFILLGSKITADGDCSYEIKRRLLPG